MFIGSTWLHAPPFLRAVPLPDDIHTRVPMTLTSVRIAIVGDVHDCWSLEEDTKALQLLKPDLVLFTGDFGNENSCLVESISNLDFPKAAILGNHDAWSTQKFSAREKDAVQLQLESLGDEHVGYRRIDFDDLKVSVVGGRPFSCGGERLFRRKLLKARYGIDDMNGSAKRIYQSALGTPRDNSIIFLAHNGPTGLGSSMDDICGRDWIPGGGDHGDPDLQQAIAQVKETTDLRILLVVFGHMHKSLAYGNALRKMLVVDDDDDGIAYLNGAIVPRVLCNKTVDEEDEHGSCSNSTGAFTVVDIDDGELQRVAETWVSVSGDDVSIDSEELIFLKKE